MAYGTASGVAALARVWTNNGAFFDDDVYTTATIPSLEQVENWLTAVSDEMDAALANEGFQVPVTVAKAISALSLQIESVVADLCHAANSSGRFFTEKAIERGVSPMKSIRKELLDWVTEHVVGLEAMGVPRNTNTLGAHEASFDMM